MSTKTSIKRIAAVAAVALTLGGFSAVSANAIALQKITLGSLAGVQTTTGTTNVAVTTLVNFNGYGTYNSDNATYQAIYSALPATSKVTPPSFTALAYNNDTYGQAASWYAPGPDSSSNFSYIAQGANSSTFEVKVSTATPGRYNMYATLSFTPDVAGTYSIMIQDPQNAYTQTTWTVVVKDPVVQSFKAYLNSDSSTALTADAASFVYAAAANVTAKGALTVKQYSTTDTTTVATTAITQAVTVTISKGLVSKTNDYFAGVKSVTTAAATAGPAIYYVFANGEVGSATLTVTVGALTSTKTITFNGVAATMTAALTAGQNTWIAPNGTATLTVGSKDSAGSASTNTPTITATSATTTVATVVATSNTLVTITGQAAGTSVITIADSAGTATSVTYTVTVAPAASVALPTLTFDKTEYMPGELMTITVGAAAADNPSFAAFAANPASSLALVTVKNPFTSGAVALVSGKATWTAYAPITPGPITVTATSSTGSAATAATVTGTATVISDGLAQAAIDAAAEAIDAANAATDAANAAAEAADAATAAAQDAADAVAALSVAVTAQIDALKAQNDALRKQLIALTNLIIKIQKKVKA